jgi:hypothetical protein
MSSKRLKTYTHPRIPRGLNRFRFSQADDVHQIPREPGPAGLSVSLAVQSRYVASLSVTQITG